jgi:hypothetical protein
MRRGGVESTQCLLRRSLGTSQPRNFFAWGLDNVFYICYYFYHQLREERMMNERQKKALKTALAVLRIEGYTAEIASLEKSFPELRPERRKWARRSFPRTVGWAGGRRRGEFLPTRTGGGSMLKYKSGRREDDATFYIKTKREEF